MLNNDRSNLTYYVLTHLLTRIQKNQFYYIFVTGMKVDMTGL